MKRQTIDISFILTLLVGAFLLLDGIAGLSQSSSFVGQISRTLGVRGSTITLVVAIVQVVAGALLILSLFLSLGELDRFLGLAIFIAWLVVMVLIFVVGNFAPDSLTWWRSLVQYGIILAVIWLVQARRA